MSDFRRNMIGPGDGPNVTLLEEYKEPFASRVASLCVLVLTASMKSSISTCGRNYSGMYSKGNAIGARDVIKNHSAEL